MEDMRVSNLSVSKNCPCFVVEIGDMSVMLDCAIDFSSVYQSQPIELVHRHIQKQGADATTSYSTPTGSVQIGSGNNEKTAISDEAYLQFVMPETSMFPIWDLDAILISNYRTFLALPYITEHCGFRGNVYCTVATFDYASLLLEELCEYVSSPGRSQLSKATPASRLHSEEFGVISPGPRRYRGCPLFSWQDAQNCLAKVKTVGFDERISLFGGVIATAHSSGLCIGSSNWSLMTRFLKMVYLAGSSQFVTHCRALDLNGLRDADIAIVSDTTNCPSTEPDCALQSFCDSILDSLKRKGNILIPCSPTGVVYDLLECLSTFLSSAGFAHVPVYFISPVAHSSLSHANIHSEWLNAAKQSKVYLPEPPFIHSMMTNNHSLSVYSSIHGAFSEAFRSPSIVFTGHPCLRFGPVVHFMRLWAGNEANCVLLIDPDFVSRQTLSPFVANMKMRAVCCPIDTRLTDSQLRKLTCEVSCRNVVIDEDVATRANLTSQPVPNTNIHHMSPLQCLNIPTSKSGAGANLLIDCRLGRSMTTAVTLPVEMSAARKKAMSVVGVLNAPPPATHDGGAAAVLKSTDSPQIQPTSFIWGNLSIDKLMKHLRLMGIVDVRVDEQLRTEGGSPTHVLSLGKVNDPDGIIILSEHSSNIVGVKDKQFRKTLTDCLISCLNQI